MNDSALELARQIVAILSESSVREISVRKGDLTVTARRPPGAAQAAPTLRAVAQTVEQKEEQVRVQAEWVGIFHAAEEEGAQPLVGIGSAVEAGQILGYIETVNLRNEVLAPVGGTVTEVAVENHQPVEYGQLLFILEPAEPA